MLINDVKSVLKTIDISYGTDYEDNKQMLEHYYKYLKNYSIDDVSNKLSEYITSSAVFPPKVFHLVHGLLTEKGKEGLKGIKEQCRICGNYVKIEDFGEHYLRCCKIDFIKIHAKKFLNQEIEVKKYYQMSEEELNNKHMQMSKIVLERSDNEILKNSIRHYIKM